MPEPERTGDSGTYGQLARLFANDRVVLVILAIIFGGGGFGAGKLLPVDEDKYRPDKWTGDMDRDAMAAAYSEWLLDASRIMDVKDATIDNRYTLIFEHMLAELNAMEQTFKQHETEEGHREMVERFKEAVERIREAVERVKELERRIHNLELSRN